MQLVCPPHIPTWSGLRAPAKRHAGKARIELSSLGPRKRFNLEALSGDKIRRTRKARAYEHGIVDPEGIGCCRFIRRNHQNPEARKYSGIRHARRRKHIVLIQQRNSRLEMQDTFGSFDDPGLSAKA